MFASTKRVYECVVTSSLQGLYNINFKQQGKVQNGIKPIAKAHPFGNNEDLQLVVHIFNFLIFSIAHCFMFLLIAHIFVVAGQE